MNETESRFVTEGQLLIASMEMPEDFHRLPHDRQAYLLGWIKQHMIEQKQWNRKESSIEMKHRYEDETGYYVTNGQFKGAMLVAGFQPENEKKQNWRFKAKIV